MSKADFSVKPISAGRFGDAIRIDQTRTQLMLENRVLFILDDGRWCYSEQIILDGGSDE